MNQPVVGIELPFGEARLIARSSRSVLVRSPRDDGATRFWRVNGVDYIGDVLLDRDGAGWRVKSWAGVLRRPKADREPTHAAKGTVEAAVLAALAFWSGTPEGRAVLAKADVADRDDAVQRLRERAGELCERAAELRGLAARVAAGRVAPDEGRNELSERRW